MTIEPPDWPGKLTAKYIAEFAQYLKSLPKHEGDFYLEITNPETLEYLRKRDKID